MFSASGVQNMRVMARAIAVGLLAASLPAPAPAAAPTIVAGTQQPAAAVQAEPTRSLADADRHDHGRHRGRGHHQDDAVAAPDGAPAPDAVVPSDQEPEAPVDAAVAVTE